MHISVREEQQPSCVGESPREAAGRAMAAAGDSATQNGWAGGWKTGRKEARKDFWSSPIIYSGIVKSNVFTGEKAVWKRGCE